MSLSFSFQGIPIDEWQRHRPEIPCAVDTGDMNKQSIASNNPLSIRR
jgi:hypothetical protein